MNELQQVLNNIKQDKNTNLLPGNLRDNVTCLGVEGTAEVPETIYRPSSYYYDSLVITDDVTFALYVDDWFIYAIDDSNTIVCYYNNNKVCQFNRTRTDSVRISCIKLGTDYIIIIITQWNQRDNLVYKININGQVSQLNSINVNNYYSLNYFTRDGDLSIDGDLYRYNEDTDELVSKYSLSGVLSAEFRGLNNFLYDNLHNNVSNYNTITKYTYNSDSNAYSVLQSKVADVDGVTYNGDKIVKAGSIYQLGSNLEVGSLLKSNVLPHLDGDAGPVINWIDSSMCEYNGVIYNFDDNNNTFTLADDLPIHTNYVVNSAAYIYFKYDNTYILLKTEYSDVEVGYNYKGNYFPKSNIVFNSGNILQGNTYYTDVLQPVGGTMPNNGELNITPTTENQNIPEGYTSGGTVLGDENLKSENIKKDVSIFGVTGSLESSSGGVKLFETEEEMQADSTAKEGDLAVVYREEIQNMTADTQTQFITFPETVILPEAFTGDVYCMLRAVDETVMFDGQVMLNQSMFDFNGYTDAGMIRVRYISSNGITYNRDEFMADSGNLTNPVDFGTTIQVYMSEEWNDSMGYFMQIGGSTFDGLYEYTSKTDTTRIDMMQNIRRDDSNELVYDAVPIEVDTLSTIIQAARTSISTNVTNYVLTNATYHNALIEKLSDTEYNVYFRAYLSSLKIVLSYCGLFEQDEAYYLADYPNGWFNTTVGTLSNSTESTTPRVYAMLKINVNLSTGVSTYTELPASDFTQTSIAGYTHAKYNKAFDANSTLVDVRYIVDSRTVTNDGSMHVTNSSNNGEYISTKYTTMYIYVIAPTQYTLTSSNQLLPNISAYGKNGNVIGDDSIYNNIPKQDYLDKLCNINAVEGTGQYTTTLQTGAILQPNKLYGCNLADTIDNTNMTIAKNTIISQIGNYSDSLKTIKSLYGVNYIVRDNYVYYLSLESDNVVIYKLDKKLNTVERHAFSDAFSDAQLEPYVAMDVVDNIMYISSNLGTTWQIITCDISNDTSSVIYSGSLSYSPYNDIRIKVSNGHIYLFHAETYVSISSQNKSKLYIKECDILGNNMKTLFSYTPGINVDQFAITSDDKYVIITDIDGETGYIFDIDAKSCSKLSFVGKPQKLCVLPIDDTFIYMIGDTDIYKININDTTVTQASISNEILTKMRFTYYINGKWYTDLNSELYNVNIISDASTKLSMSWFANDYLPNKDDSETRFSRVQLQQSYDVIQSNNIVDIYALSASSKTKGVIKLSLLNLTLDKIDIWNLPKMIIAGSTNDNIPVVLCDNLASLSQAEYNTALDTTEQILGKGKM